MSPEETVRQQLAAINRHDSRAAAACYTPSAVVADPQYPDHLRGTAAIAKDFAEYFAAFPDLELRRATLVANGVSYAFEGAMTGTHQGPLIGPTGLITATGRTIDVPLAVHGDLDEHGRIANERRYYDVATLLGQLGLMQ